LIDSIHADYNGAGPAGAYYLGLVPPDANLGGVLGCGETPGRAAASITSGGTRWGPIVAAQEVAHNFGRNHATAGCGAGNPDGAYPRPNGLLDDWGLDPALRQLYPPASSYDYMGYCGDEGNTWTSAYTYLALMRSLPVADAPSTGAHLASLLRADGPVQLVGGGSISPDAFSLQRGFYRSALPEGIEDGLPMGPFSVQQLDRAGGILYSRDFGLIPLSNQPANDTGTFQIILPDTAGAAEVVFLYKGTEIGRVTASANAPQVRITSPAGGEDWGAVGSNQIAWEASDPDGDALRFNVQVSSDAGVSWTSLGIDLEGTTSITIDSADLPGGSLLFRVLASDGLNQAESVSSAPVTVADKPPLVHIGSPVDGDAFPVGEAVVLRGYAADLEDVVVDEAAFRWMSDRDGEVGQGPTLWGLPLSAGEHQITLTVTDRAGGSASESVHITVGSPEEAPSARTPIAGLLLIAGGLLVLGSVVGILVFSRRGGRA
jgi:hypothetical protein